jgi:hypothetical protein
VHIKIPELGYFRLVRQTELEFEKTASPSSIQVTSLFTASNNLLENSFLKKCTYSQVRMWIDIETGRHFFRTKK